MRLELIPFQGFDWPIDQFSPGLPSVQSGCRVCTLFDIREDPYDGPIALIDEFDFEFAVLAKGRRQPLYGQALEDYRKRRAAKVRVPRPPTVQVLLKQACKWKERLDRSPGLTRDALAREVGISPTRMTMILHLANLAPEIQEHIRALKPLIPRSPITERQLRILARVNDRQVQIRGFNFLLTKAGMACII